MIALRGVIHQSSSDSNKWQWSGLWTFGKLPDHVGRDLESVKVKIPNVRPFHYSWEKAVSASTVEVPSLVANQTRSKQEEEEDKQEIIEQKSKPLAEQAKAAAVAVANEGAALVDKGEEQSTVSQDLTASIPKENTMKELGRAPVAVAEKEGDEAKPAESQRGDSKIATGDESKKDDGATTTNTSNIRAPSSTSKEEPSLKLSDQSSTTATSEKETSHETKAEPSDPKLKPLGITFATMLPDEPSYTEAATLLLSQGCPKDGAWTGYFENIIRGRKAHNRVAEEFSLFLNATPPKDARTIFLEEDEDVAGGVSPPADGSGESKDDKAQEQAKIERTKQAAAALLPTGKIHVRGVGTNQFGIFELLGSFDPDTKVLELQRMYVSTADPNPAPKSSSPVRKTPNKSSAAKSAGGTGSTNKSRPYSTRKRQLSWQRRSTLSDDEDEIVGIRRHSGASKKRPRSGSTTSGVSAADSSKSSSSSMPPPGQIMLQSSSIPSGGTRPPSLIVPGGVVSSSSTSASKKRPSPTATAAAGTSSPKKRGGSAQAKSAAAAAAAATSPSTVVKVPSVGAATEARWRAAHFLYYQRNDQSFDDTGASGTSAGNSNSGAAAATSFVVYEGELLLGKCMREGRGVCLYNNGTLYEGDWKKNREHGKGTLMTADRRRIIYKGEWERGRMHGAGSYFFRPSEATLFAGGPTPGASSSQDGGGGDGDGGEVTPRYEGEFKENCRHGTGKYYLPNGSTYDGEWRENLMSGRGTFIWPGGSAYIGQWKDGKRHGQGLLRSSDFFTYDGMWVNNAMEGRGIAVYPGGQKYEGLWAHGRREGRGTIVFVNGAIYEGRFRDDAIEGQGTMKMASTAKVPISNNKSDDDEGEKSDDAKNNSSTQEDWMIPISFQSDMGHIHQKAGFTAGGE
jgi:hypothetical protein